MEHQKIINLLKDTLDQKNDLRRMFNTNSQIRFKTAMLKLSLCDYIDAYLPIKETLTLLVWQGADTAAKQTKKNNRNNNYT